MLSFVDIFSLTAGELSPQMMGRTDHEKYYAGAASIFNMIVRPQGGATRRPGTDYVAKSKIQNTASRLRRFVFNTVQAYTIEFGTGYARFYMNDAQIAGGAGEVTTNGQFVANIAGWTDGSNGGAVAIWDPGNGGQAKLDTNPGTGLGIARLRQTLTGLTVGAIYKVTLTTTNGNGSINVGTALNGTDVGQTNFATAATTIWSFLATASTVFLQLVNQTATSVVLVGGISILGAVASVPYEIATPYVVLGDIKQLSFTQSADTLYCYHPKYPTQKMTRSAHASWSIDPIDWKDGPYLPVNTGNITLAPSVATGTGITIAAAPAAKAVTGAADNGAGLIRLLAVAHGFATGDPITVAGVNGTAEANGNWIAKVIDANHVDLPKSFFINAWTAGGTISANVFDPADVGRLVRIQHGSTWGYAKVTAFTDSHTVTADVVSAFGAATAQKAWRLGSWGAKPGYPYTGTFHQQRLAAGGNDNQPNGFFASVVGDFENQAPTATDGTVTDKNALNFVISDDQVNAIRALSAAGNAQAAQLGIFTSGSEQILQQQTTTAGLSPTNIQAYRETSYGTIANVEPQRVGKQVLFFNQAGRKLHAWTFDWTANGYEAPDLTELADHITWPGVAWHAYQKNPWSIDWVGLNDGSLIGITYRPQQKVFAWHRHQLGGNYYGGPPLVESGDVIPAPDGSYDELWLQVVRTINGQVVRTIEVMGRPFEKMQAEEAQYVDCALGLALTSLAATLTPGVAGGHTTPIAGDTVTFSAGAAVFNVGMIGSVIRASRGKALITAYTDAQHVQALVLTSMRNCEPQAAGTWTCTAPDTTLNLPHLPGETVRVFGDGADYGLFTADGTGLVTVDPGITTGVAGLPFDSEIVFMPFEPAHAMATATNGKLKRIDTLWLRLFETGGCSFGMLGNPLDDLETRNAADLMGQAAPLISRMERVKPSGSDDEDWQLVLRSVGAMPLTLLAVSARADVGEISNG